MNDIPLEPERVFFPLAWLPAQDMEGVLKLFSYCEKNGIDIIHSCDSIGQVQPSNVIQPGSNQNGPAMMTIQLFYGACESEEHFRNVFGFDYDINKSHQVQPIIAKEISRE